MCWICGAGLTSDGVGEYTRGLGYPLSSQSVSLNNPAPPTYQLGASLFSPGSWLSSILKPSAIGLTLADLTGMTGDDVGIEVAALPISEDNQVAVWRHVCW